jgi:hypothetical protein
LTAHEVRHAKAHYPGTALFIVANITVNRSSSGPPIAVGGTTLIAEPWDILECDLTAIAYSYRVQRNV